MSDAPPVRTHPPASEKTIREALANHPEWMVQECITWTRDREARGHQFTNGAAAARHWLDGQQRGPASARQLLTADQIEVVFHAALALGDVHGVEAALLLMVAQDPRRAATLYENTRTALAIAGIVDPTDPTEKS